MRRLRHKFGAKQTITDGIKFGSKAEAAYYNKLKILQSAGKILFFLRQVPFALPGNVTYRADFVEFWENGDVLITEVKGFETPEWKIKKKIVESLYPITINVIKVR